VLFFRNAEVCTEHVRRPWNRRGDRCLRRIGVVEHQPHLHARRRMRTHRSQGVSAEEVVLRPDHRLRRSRVQTHTKAACTKDVADARAGKATFFPDRIDACLAKVPPLLDSCFETIDLVLRAVETLRGCQSFEGTLADGAPCDRDSQCKPAIGADESSGCNDDTKTCRTTKILADGAACSLAKGTPSFCGRNLFCDATGAALTGTCKKATPVGTPCDAKATPSLECGLGNYCDESTALCAIGKGSGASCKTLLECASLQCEDTGGKKCTPPKAIVDVDECKGP